jgi:hypothetical protein
MTVDRHISQEDLALHAMQALSPEESPAIGPHLAGCDACRAELAELSRDLALLAMSVEQHPVPEGARQRFLDRIAADGGVTQARAGAPVVSMERGRLAKRPAAWLAWSAAAALLLFAIGLGIRVRSLNDQLDETSKLLAAQTVENRRAEELLDLMTTAGAQHVLLTAGKTPPAPSARALYLASRGALILEASNLKPLPEGKTYELWVIPANGSAPIPAGLFQPDAAGSASVVLPKIAEGVPAKAFGVTIEKGEGSATPTAPILLSGAVAGE